MEPRADRLHYLDHDVTYLLGDNGEVYHCYKGHWYAMGGFTERITPGGSPVGIEPLADAPAEW